MCPCQLSDKKGIVGMQLKSVKDHSDSQEHKRWAANLKLTLTSTESVIGITEANGYWKHKYLFNTQTMTVFVFFPRQRPNPCVLTYKITPCIRQGTTLNLVPEFLNEVADKLERASDILEPQGNLDAFLLVSKARNILLQWNADATSSSGESLHSLQPLDLPQLQRSETTSVEIGDDEEEEQKEKEKLTETKKKEEESKVKKYHYHVPVSTEPLEVIHKHIQELLKLQRNPEEQEDDDDEEEQQQEEVPVATSSNASACADDSIADMFKQRKAKLIETKKKEEEETKDDKRLKQWREKRK